MSGGQFDCARSSARTMRHTPMWALSACRRAHGIKELPAPAFSLCFSARLPARLSSTRLASATNRTRHVCARLSWKTKQKERPPNSRSMTADSISFGGRSGTARTAHGGASYVGCACRNQESFYPLDFLFCRCSSRTQPAGRESPAQTNGIAPALANPGCHVMTHILRALTNALRFAMFARVTGSVALPSPVTFITTDVAPGGARPGTKW